MGTAAGNIAGALGVLLLGGFYLLISFSCFWEELQTRIYPQGKQKLATTCEVSEIQKFLQQKERVYEGYFFEGEKKIEADVVENRKGEVKVGWTDVVSIDRYGTRWYGNTQYKWLSAKNFHKYHTLKELSELVNKRK